MFGGECCNQNDVNKGAPHRFKMCCGDGQINVAKGAAVDQAFEHMVVNEMGNQLPLLNSMVAFAGVNHYKAECPGQLFTFKVLGHFQRIMCLNLQASKTFAGGCQWTDLFILTKNLPILAFILTKAENSAKKLEKRKDL
jgi:hypothetical protein